MRISAFHRVVSVAVLAIASISLAGVSAHASAEELKIAVAADVTSIDPHFFNLFPNNNIAELQSAEIFDPVANTITPLAAQLTHARVGTEAMLSVIRAGDRRQLRIVPQESPRREE